MLRITTQQMSAFEADACSRFIVRLNGHLQTLGAPSSSTLAEGATVEARKWGLKLEDEICALAEMMLHFGSDVLEIREPAWVAGIVEDAGGYKAVRLRRCFDRYLIEKPSHHV